jgi:uncharacterized protein (TIGR02145 family)
MFTTNCKKASNNDDNNENPGWLNCGTVTDIDGNIYETITIGTQCWMKSNLKVTHYRNGDQITFVTSYSEWSNITTGAYCNLNHESSNSIIYGRLYNWYAVADNRNIAPEGWHIPSDAEWTILTDYLKNNGYGYQGNDDHIAKAMADSSCWFNYPTPGTPGNNLTSNNSSGFSARPGGCLTTTNSFIWTEGKGGFWWTSTVDSSDVAWHRHFYHWQPEVYRYSSSKKFGLSVRCIKD